MNKNTKMTFYRSISNETALAGCLSPSFEKSKTITENILFKRNFINEWKHKKLSIVARVKEVIYSPIHKRMIQQK